MAQGDERAAVVEIDLLVRRFGDHQALEEVSLRVEPGKVHGIVGENGAGKTTLIKHILGQYRAQQGTVRVFGLDPVREPARVLERIGYLSEEPDLPAWMTVDAFLRYMAAFYPKWDMAVALQLLERFGLPHGARIGELSKGQRTRLGLTAAQAHSPDLLLLDEPSSGLDPIVRRDILGAIMDTTRGYGGTVLFSSHLLEEVEAYSHHLTMLRQGRVLVSSPMEAVLGDHLSIRVQDGTELRRLEALDGVLSVQADDGAWKLSCYGRREVLLPALEALGAPVLAVQALTLDEIFALRSRLPLPSAGAR